MCTVTMALTGQSGNLHIMAEICSKCNVRDFVLCPDIVTIKEKNCLFEIHVEPTMPASHHRLLAIDLRL